MHSLHWVSFAGHISWCSFSNGIFPHFQHWVCFFSWFPVQLLLTLRLFLLYREFTCNTLGSLRAIASFLFDTWLVLIEVEVFFGRPSFWSFWWLFLGSIRRPAFPNGILLPDPLVWRGIGSVFHVPVVPWRKIQQSSRFWFFVSTILRELEVLPFPVFPRDTACWALHLISLCFPIAGHVKKCQNGNKTVFNLIVC